MKRVTLTAGPGERCPLGLKTGTSTHNFSLFTFDFQEGLQSNFALKTYSNDIVSVEDTAGITTISVFSNCTLHLRNKIRK